MNKTPTAVTGEGNAPLLLTWPFGDWCIYCGKDAETCEHFEASNRDADGSLADCETDAERNQ